MTMYNPPRKNLISQLAHVELLTPRLDDSVTFFSSWCVSMAPISS